MTWYAQETTTRFDQTPLEGLFFLHGDVIVRALQALVSDRRCRWPEGMKSPMVMFPSGEALPVEWDIADSPWVQVFPGLDVPLLGTFAQALQAVQEQLDEGWFSLFADGELQLEVWSHLTEQVGFLTYDNEAEKLVDVTIMPA